MIPLLKGVRLLELSSVVMGPLAGQILADLGAEVIKVEPLEGDIARGAPPRAGDLGALFANNNRNKRVIAVDLKSDSGKQIARRLVVKADALLINMRPAAAQRVGLGFDELVQLNPNLIYCAAIGFGEEGPYRGRPAFDDVVQAAAGLADLGRRDAEPPRFVSTIVADKVGALHAAYAVLAALVAKARGRMGPVYVEVPMFESLASFVLNEHLSAATFEEDGGVGYSRVLSPDRRPFRTQDGWMAVLPYTVEQWRRFLSEVGRSDLVARSWFENTPGRQAHIDELYAAIAEAMPHRTTATWFDILIRLDIPCSPVAGLQDLLTDPHLSAIGFFDTGPRYPATIRRKLAQPARFRGIDPVDDEPPHSLGADTRCVLRECGYSDPEIDELAEAGSVFASEGR